ncbi:MAG: prolyl oligopeptidase family serine peptidase [Bacteroidota bacterium]
MKNIIFVFGIFSIVACTHGPNKEITIPEYPVAPSEPITEMYFGRSITDDYRNLENLEDSSVLNWFEEEAIHAEKVIKDIPGRDRLLEKLKELDQRKSNDIRNINITEDDQYFFLKQGSDEDVAKVYYRKNFSSKDELLYDPKDFKPELGRKYLVNYIKPCWDGSFLVVSLTHSGAEISEMIIIDMSSREVLPQVISNCWPSDGGGISWLPDNSGFFYLHYPEIDPTSDLFLKNMKSVLYKIGNNPNELNVQLSRETHPELGIKPEDFPMIFFQSKNDRYIYGLVGGATAYFDAYVAELSDLETGKLEWKPFHKKTEKISWGYFEGDSFIFLSAKNSPNFRILKTPVLEPNFDKPEVLVEEKSDEVINDFRLTSEGIYYTTTQNGVESKLYNLENGKDVEIKLPKASGSVNLFIKGPEFTDLWVSTMGWLNDFIRYKYNKSENSFTQESFTEETSYPEFDDFVVKELLVSSHDGEEVPLSVIYKNGVKLNGENSTLIFGYGAYGVPINPYFIPGFLSWVDEGGVMAIAHVRGGGEKGDFWYQSGKKTTKSNTWKDLIACTEFLIKEGFTSKSKVAIRSASAGGVLIGRALTERPDLFAVAIAEVGIMNTLRAEHSPNGPNNTKEFGISKDSVECLGLIEMDSYLHIEKGTAYPATLITAGMNDPRVIAWQPGKFAAKLQASNSSNKPILFSVDYESGHGLDDSKSKALERLASNFAFALWQTGHPNYSF